jgi:TolB-like protein
VQAGEISVVVLPFTNLSGDPEQEFFADGMTEEITAALARVPRLRVIGRTSAFQFKGQSRDFAAIRQALDVPYLVDGSVRKAGDRVRITAQLIQSENGVSIWTRVTTASSTACSYPEDIAGGAVVERAARLNAGQTR